MDRDAFLTLGPPIRVRRRLRPHVRRHVDSQWQHTLMLGRKLGGDYPELLKGLDSPAKQLEMLEWLRVAQHVKAPP